MFTCIQVERISVKLINKNHERVKYIGFEGAYEEINTRITLMQHTGLTSTFPPLS